MSQAPEVAPDPRPQVGLFDYGRQIRDFPGLPSVPADERKALEFEVRARASNVAAVNLQHDINAGRDEIRAKIAHIVDLQNDLRARDSTGAASVRIQWKIDEAIEDIAIIEARVAIIALEHDRYHAEWEPLANLARDLRSNVDSRRHEERAQKREGTGAWNDLGSEQRRIAAERQRTLIVTDDTGVLGHAPHDGPPLAFPTNAPLQAPTAAPSSRPAAATARSSATPGTQAQASGTSSNWLARLQQQAYGKQGGGHGDQ